MPRSDAEVGVSQSTVLFSFATPSISESSSMGHGRFEKYPFPRNEPSLTIEAMTLFLYCFDYESPADSSAMMFHAEVYQIADKYGIEALKRLSATKFRASMDENWKTDDFPAAIALAYTTTPPEDRGLRDITVQVAFNNIGTLMSRDAFCETLSDNPDLAADIIRFMHGKWSELEEYKCSSCESVFLIGTVTLETGDSPSIIHNLSEKSSA
ncbi:hypothetical protein ACKAV7_013859 [Fusarium commune]